MDILEVRIRNTIAATEEAATIISVQRSDAVTVREVETALCERLGLDQIADILDRDIDTAAVVAELKGFDFACLRPEKMDEIRFDESIIPEGVPILLTEAEVKIKGEVWVVHKNDADPFPSNPHAHNYENRLKMHLGTGDLYKGKVRTPCKRMTKALLVEFRSRLLQKNASISLPPLLV
jgi:hypothetical protein